MCGIAGYIGKEKSLEFLLEILRRLEYRGYDSCGVAVKGKKFYLKKIKGKIKDLEKKTKNRQLKFRIGIAHTRWATHGEPTSSNAHPHFDCNKEIFLVHNGIIENYIEIKRKLATHKFRSFTDTEVIVHLLEELARKKNLAQAALCLPKYLKGSYALCFFSRREERLILVKKDSPLCIGKLKEGFIVASDLPAIIPFTKQILILEDEEVGFLDGERLEVVDFKRRKKRVNFKKMELVQFKTEKEKYPHYMLKEIFEQPQVIRNLLSFYLKEEKIVLKDLNFSKKFLSSLKRIFIFGCGTAFHAGLVGKYFLEKYCHLPVEIDVSSEARYRKFPIGEDDLVIAISQSGETADTLASVREAKRRRAKVLGICNVLGSRLTKEVDGLIYTLAGPEIGVASTKAYTAQIFCLYLFSLYLAYLRGEKNRLSLIKKELRRIPDYMEKVLRKSGKIEKIAEKFSKYGCFLFLGRGINYPSALEGALKLKEISYIPAEGYPAGEMKHGPIALIDEYRAVVCIALRDSLYQKMVSNICEIKARKGKVLGIISENDIQISPLVDEKITMPSLNNFDLSPLLVALPLQLFAYFVARNLGCEIDQPRNLAKSVTVE
ncbi:MAG: glutamine--fructose-6-phosphate transaminase (isomerizing) [Candidatus Omnitrophica bacterium 4484_70.1]|nr:MAG: glutamine--fructose-6-phosphate transaminase (isomerizing) [Candidatus Omnitrophica bacterium 4484_70.1]